MTAVCYAVHYRPATEKRGARFNVKQINTGRTKSVTYDFGHNSPPRKAIHDAFGDDTARIEYVGLIESGKALYAV
jgi:hypothetical protein